MCYAIIDFVLIFSWITNISWNKMVFELREWNWSSQIRRRLMNGISVILQILQPDTMKLSWSHIRWQSLTPYFMTENFVPPLYCLNFKNYIAVNYKNFVMMAYLFQLKWLQCYGMFQILSKSQNIDTKYDENFGIHLRCTDKEV